MASGEMSSEEFLTFLTKFLSLAESYVPPGSLFYVCMDWRHMGEMLGSDHTLHDRNFNGFVARNSTCATADDLEGP